MKVLIFITVILTGYMAGCDSDTVAANIQTTTETATVAVGEAEIVRAGGRLKFTATAALSVPLGGVTADIKLESTITSTAASDAFTIVAGIFDVTPTSIDFERPAQFTMTAPDNIDRLGAIWRATPTDPWIGLPSTLVGVATEGDDIANGYTLTAWVFSTGQIAAVRWATETGACCTNDSCNVVAKNECSGTYFGTGSDCSSEAADLCGTRCCLSTYTPSAETTSSEGNLIDCLSEGLWPLGAGSTCDTQCCAINSGPGVVSTYTELCAIDTSSTSCSVCCLDDSKATYTEATDCVRVDTTGASCETICCASSKLSPVQGFKRVTRTECEAVAGLESFQRYCDLCASDIDCQDPPTGCHTTTGSCDSDGLCSYDSVNACTQSADCSSDTVCGTDCTCQ